MENYLGPGEKVELTAPTGGVISGVPVKIGRLLAIPEFTAAQGEPFTGLVSGLVTLPKVAAEPWTEGMLVWFNSGSLLATSVSTTSMLIGVATKNATNPSATGRVLLNYGNPITT